MTGVFSCIMPKGQPDAVYQAAEDIAVAVAFEQGKNMLGLSTSAEYKIHFLLSR